MRVSTIEAAAGKWRPILLSFGVNEKQLSGKHGPCPCCGGNDRFRFDNKDGSGSYYCNRCGAGYGIDLVMKITGKGFKDAAKAIDQVIGTVHAEPAKKEKSIEEIRADIKRILSGTSRKDSMGYLQSRGINSRPDLVFHPALEYWEGKKKSTHPAMIGVVRDASGNGVAIHRTYLKQGGKADVAFPKKLSQSVAPLQGSAIRLYPATDTLGVAEGIETACSAHQIFGMPVWSCISSTLLESFVPPAGVKKLVIFGDNDANFAGQKAAYTLANRVKGVSVLVKIPERFRDWNDTLLSKETA